MEGAHYIYGLFCPAEHQFRYVGKTRNIVSRFQDHCRDTGQKTDKPPTERQVWVKSLKDQGLKPKLVILEYFEYHWKDAQQAITVENYAKIAERQWIKRLRDEGHPLTNNGYEVQVLMAEELVEKAIVVGQPLSL